MKHKHLIIFCFALALLLWQSISASAQELHFTPNQPIGEARGIYPGRVTWIRDGNVAKWNGKDGHWWDDGNIDQAILNRMYAQSLCALSGEPSSSKAWTAIFKYYNTQHGRGNRGYQKGEKIAIKINLNNTYEVSDSDNDIDQSPQATIAILQQLTQQANVPQECITIYDATIGWKKRAIPDRIYRPVHQLFPLVKWMSAMGSEGVDSAHWVKNAISYTDPSVSLGTVLPQAVVEAQYLINIALLKGHEINGVTLCAKNHFGSIPFPVRMHNSTTVSQMSGKEGDYSAFVDLMGCPNLGKKTLLYVVDGIYGMQTNVGAPRPDRDKWKMFDNQWSGCYFMSLDPVAIESVCMDFLFAEFGKELGFSGAPQFKKGSSQNCDNYLKEAAKGWNAKWGDYRPNGVKTGSLGVFEHWNNAHDKQYSRNLGKNKGIELYEIKEDAKQNEVQVSVHVDKPLEEMKPLWAWFGYDEPNYTYMKDGKKLLTDIANLSPVPVYVRTHNLMTSGDGTPALKWGATNIYTEDKNGRPQYHWNIVDSIFDTYIERGMHPLVQIGFMPKDLSSHPNPYQHHWTPDAKYDEIFTGWAYPPKNYKKWGELVYQWALHCKERYGIEEVNSWYWEVWNEPAGYLIGSFEDYCKIYDYAVDGLLKALPNAIVGGPHTAGAGGKENREYFRKFIEHCLYGKNYATGKKGSPLRYLGFHAKGYPQLINDRIMMKISAQLNDVKAAFDVISSYPELKNLPLIVGEFDPEGCAACSSEYTPNYNYRNGTVYSSTVADSYARLYELKRKYGLNLIGAVTWAFEFENQPWFAGFRDLATNGVTKPVLNVFRMFGQMGGTLVEAKSSAMLPLDSICKNSVRDAADIGVLASAKDKEATIMIWNYHDDNFTSVAPAHIFLKVDGNKTAKQALITHYRVDGQHSNAYTKWQEMGSPKSPSQQQILELEKSGNLQTVESPRWVKIVDGNLPINFDLPRQGVSLIKIEY